MDSGCSHQAGEVIIMYKYDMNVKHIVSYSTIHFQAILCSACGVSILAVYMRPRIPAPQFEQFLILETRCLREPGVVMGDLNA